MLVALFVLWWSLPLAQLVQRGVSIIQALGAGGIAVFALLYVVAILALAPGTMLTLAAGFIWGPLGGTLIVCPAAVLAATTAFLLGRTVAREQVARRFGESPLFVALDRAAEREGAKVVVLLRLSPVSPFNVLNYAFGLTRLSAKSYALATALGILPVTVLYTYVGSVAKSVTELGTGALTREHAVLQWVGLGVTLLVTLVVARIAKRALSERAL